MRSAPEGKTGTAAAGDGADKPGASGIKSDPARLARIRGSRMPAITRPVQFHTPEADAICSALEVFPPDNLWNQLVDDWPLHPKSDAIIASIVEAGNVSPPHLTHPERIAAKHTRTQVNPR